MLILHYGYGFVCFSGFTWTQWLVGNYPLVSDDIGYERVRLCTPTSVKGSIIYALLQHDLEELG